MRPMNNRSLFLCEVGAGFGWVSGERLAVANITIMVASLTTTHTEACTWSANRFTIGFTIGFTFDTEQIKRGFAPSLFCYDFNIIFPMK